MTSWDPITGHHDMKQSLQIGLDSGATRASANGLDINAYVPWEKIPTLALE